MSPASLLFRVALALPLLAGVSAAQDWNNYGGDAKRNGQSPEYGPVDAVVQWSNTDDFSLIAWHPFIEGDRVFVVREAGFPQTGGNANDAIVAYNLDTGGELWRTTLPWGGDTTTEWLAWIGGVHSGRLYASRSSHQKPQPILCLDVTNGAILWSSVRPSESWAHDGMIFAPDGDPIVGDFRTLTRIESTDGSTVWSVPRSCSVSGNCGAAASGTALYHVDAAPGGHVIVKLDLTTGAYAYTSGVMPGFTAQNPPFLSPDGTTVYFSRSQNNPPIDELYAMEDTGTGFLELWSTPILWTTTHEHGIGPDGSIYTINQLNELVRLDAATGLELANAGALDYLGGSRSPKTVVDALGNVYLSNGWASTPATDGRMWAYSADLTQNLFTLPLDRQNAGGPAMGRDGTLVLADRVGVYAYRTDSQATVTTRNTAPNHASFTSTPAILGHDATFTVDLTTSGHTMALVGGYSGVLNLPLAGGYVVLVNIADPMGDLLRLLPAAGPLAVSTVAVPPDYALCGVTVNTQALHFGGIVPFALSNAQDLLLGTH